MPQEKKTQFALLIGQMGKGILGFLFGVLIFGSIWGMSSSVPESPNFGPQLEEIPDVPWDYAMFKNVDYTHPATTEQVAYGRRLVDATADHIGPKTSKPFAGNNLNCSSCHLDGGGKPFAAPFVTVPSQFPQFRGRENMEGTIEEHQRLYATFNERGALAGRRRRNESNGRLHGVVELRDPSW